jgi:hypothetical protein
MNIARGAMQRLFSITLILLGVVFFSAAFAEEGKPLIFSYSGGTGNGESTSKFTENAWTYKYQYHVLSLTGDVPQGRMFTLLQLEERDYMTGLGYARFSLWGSKYSIDAGDTNANFSELSLNNVAFQGVGITLKPANNFSLNVVGGTRGNGIWGYDVRRDTRAKVNFTGVRAAYLSDIGLGLNAAYVNSPTGSDVFTYGTDYGIGGLTLAAEYGTATDGKAFRGEVKYNAGWFSLGNIYRDIDTTYQTPVDYTNYQGIKGNYTSMTLSPINNMSINVQNNSYFDNLNTSAETMVLDTRGDMNYNMTSTTNIGYSGWRNDRTAYERGGISEGEMMYITQQFYLITKNAIYYRFQPTWFTSLSTSDASYSEDKNVAGINIALFDALRLNYEIENSTRMLRETDVQLNPQAMTARIDLFETQIMGSAFYLSSSANYRKEWQQENNKATDEATSTYTDVTLKYVPSQDLSCYITAKVLDYKAPEVERVTRQQNDISFGLNYAFNTYIYLK